MRTATNSWSGQMADTSSMSELHRLCLEVAQSNTLASEALVTDSLRAEPASRRAKTSPGWVPEAGRVHMLHISMLYRTPSKRRSKC